MMKGMYISAAGMSLKINEINEITANLANVNTSGFKRTQLVSQSFGDLITQFAQPTPFNKVGVGVQEVGRARFDTQGPLIRTNDPLHMAITGDGYFQIQDANGNVQVTRNGDFRLDNQGYLAAQTGERVLGVTNQPIQLGVVANQTMTVSQDGTILSGAQPVARLKVVGREEANADTFPQSSAAAPAANGNYTVEQGYLENSNVSVIAEMVNMITINKAYSMGQNAITTQNKMLEKTVNDLGRVQ